MRYLEHVCAAVFRVALALLSSAPASAQGYRGPVELADMSPQSQRLSRASWDSVGYCTGSPKHFVRSVEQTYRVRQGNQVMNKIACRTSFRRAR